MTKKKKPTYKEAIEEIESIVEALESDEMDVDDLADKSTRAAELIKFCQNRLSETQAKVGEVLEQLGD